MQPIVYQKGGRLAERFKACISRLYGGNPAWVQIPHLSFYNKQQFFTRMHRIIQAIL